jgi:hypothetical protein
MTNAKRGRRGQHAPMTAEEYRALIQALVDQACADQSIPNGSPRRRSSASGAEIEVPPETE